MKKYVLFSLAFFLFGWLATINAQTLGEIKAADVAVSPVVSNSTAPVYYYIMSAATGMVPGDNGAIPHTYFPMSENNVVLANSSQNESNYKARMATYTPNEHFLLVEENGVLKLKNRGTGGYMINSWGSSVIRRSFSIHFNFRF